MRTSLSSFPAGSVLPSSASVNNEAANTPPQGESSDSFADVLQQQESGSPKTPAPKANSTNQVQPTPKSATTTTTDNPTTELPSDRLDPSRSSEPTPASTGTTPPQPTATTPAQPSIPDSSSKVTSCSALSAMIIQASLQGSSAPKASTPVPASNSTPANSPDLATLFAQAKNAQQVTTLPPASPTLAKTSSGSTKNSSTGTTTGTTAGTSTTLFSSGSPDLSTVIAQATILAANALQANASTPSPTVTPKTPGGATKDSSAGTTSGPSSPLFPSGAPDLSTMIAQATILAANAQPDAAAGATPSASALSSIITASSAAGLGNELPLPGSSATSASNLPKEKKSATATGEGSFLQSGTASSSTAASVSNTLGAAFSGINELTAAQQVTPISGSNNSTQAGLSNIALISAGITNVEKGKAMNANLNSPELEILAGYGANAPVQQSAPDMNILLSSNNDFHDALKQVMHVAELTQTSQSLTPMRVEMEIQTPPGAIVNVYVSRQNDQWRAQLSTNDPQALAWVQDQMSSLRQSNDLGVSVRWLPPQMESGTFATSTSSSGQDANLGWDRGGQGQSNYQQQDERSHSDHDQDDEAFPELATIGAGSFLSPLTAFGRAA